jgi:hypothetical protein
MKTSEYLDHCAFHSDENKDAKGEIIIMNSVLDFLTDQLSHGVLHRSMIPELFADHEIVLKKLSRRLNYIAEVLIFAFRAKEWTLPEKRDEIFTRVMSVMYYEWELTSESAQRVLDVLAEHSTSPVNENTLESLVRLAKEDRNNILAIIASLVSHVKQAMLHTKAISTEPEMVIFAGMISEQLLPAMNTSYYYDITVMSKIIYDILVDHVTVFCNFYYKHFHPNREMDSIFLPHDLQRTLASLRLGCDMEAGDHQEALSVSS